MTAIEYLQSEAHAQAPFSLVAQGFLWAEASCRIDGTMAMALRKSDDRRASLLLAKAVGDGCTTMADAWHWLNSNRTFVLEILG